MFVGYLSLNGIYNFYMNCLETPSGAGPFHKIAFGFILILLIQLSSLNVFAQVKDSVNSSPRALVHILDYVAQDYPGAVSHGKIMKQSEFAEQRQFAHSAHSLVIELIKSGVLKNGSNLISQVVQLENQISARAGSDEIAKIAHTIKNEVIRQTGMKVAPMSWPDLAAGKKLFSQFCVSCHGTSGTGDGKLAATLNPKPANLVDGKRIQSISPFQVFNTIRMGVQGTAMPAFRGITDKQAWALAFYVKSLHARKKNPALAKTPIATLNQLRSDVDLEKVATLNDAELKAILAKKELANPGIAMSELRLAGNRGMIANSLSLAVSYLDQVQKDYQKGKINEARRKAVLAYLDGVEPVEPSLRAHAPELITTLENKMTVVRGDIEKGVSIPELDRSIQAAKVYINKAKNVLESQNNSAGFAFIMAASILLREGLEAFLIILAILGVIRAVGSRKAALWVHAGWILAILFGVVAWFFTDWIISIGFGPVHRELMEGGVSLVAVVVLLYVGFWLHSKTEINKWKEFIEVRVKNMTTGGNLLGLASIAFFAVFREALESVLFLSALTIEGGPGSKVAVGFGAVTAILIVIILGAVVLRFSARLPIRKLFKYSSFMLGFLSIVLVGKGIHSLQEIGWMSVTTTPFSLNINLIGLYPTLQTIIAQLIILAIIIIVWNYPKWKARRVYLPE